MSTETSSATRFVNSFTYPVRFPSVPKFAFDEATTTSAAGAAPAVAPVPDASSTAPAAPSGAPDGRGTPTPSSAAGDPFAGFDGQYGDVGDDVIEIPADSGTAPGAQVPAAQATPQPAPAPAAQPPAAPQGAEPPVAPPVSPPAVTPSTSSADPLSVAIEGFERNAKELANHAAQHIFKLSDEDATALATNAEEVIPRLMGQVYTKGIAAAGNLMRSFIPQMIEAAVAQINTKSEKSKEALSEFYKSNPDLNEKDHGADVAKWARSFRTANPTAPRSAAIAFVANAIRAERGLPPLSQKGAPPAARSAAFAPARPGGFQSPPAQEVDPYVGIGMEFDDQ